ncbi:MAG TPA: hypothetical protein VEX13_14105, partial [Chloroflexia bacterium]|nr:hypothetical protein [Chloroflexia bacterium]
MVRRIFTNKWVITGIVSLLALLGLLSVVGFSLPGNTNVGTEVVRQVEQTPTAIVIAEVVRTPVPSATATPTATLTTTPSPEPTATPQPATPTALPEVVAVDPAPEATPATNGSQPDPSPTRDPDILPNGVRYGDHHPNLPGRVVRIASPNIKLDTKIYEVYVTKKGLWEVADYAAGHHYSSANPG